MEPYDTNLKRIPTKNKMYEVLASTLLSISIPSSDSSQEAFMNLFFQVVALQLHITPGLNLPVCMRERIYLVNLEDPNWLGNAIQYAKEIVKKTILSN